MKKHLSIKIIISLFLLVVFLQCKESSTAQASAQSKEALASGNDDDLAKKLEQAEKMLSSTDEAAVEKVNQQKVYNLYCALCHGAKGDKSLQGSKLLTESTMSLKEMVAQVYFGKGNMVPYKGTLSDVEIVAVSKFVESLR